MTLNFIFQKTRSATTAFALAAAFAIPCTQACGPDFPNRYFDAPTAQILAAPDAFFAHEISLIAGCETHSPDYSGGTSSETANDEVADLRKALKAEVVSDEKTEELITIYASIRAQIPDMSLEALRKTLPPEIPEEFSLYLSGALAYKRKDFASAKASWEKLLQLPESERRYRSTWAAFMLGNCRSSKEDAVMWLRKVRELAAAGFNDSQNLADASWGWEAKTYLDDDDLLEATRLYLKHYQVGAPSALNSLRQVMTKALAQSRYRSPEDNPVYKFARDPIARRIWTAFILSHENERYHWDFQYQEEVNQACTQWVQILKEEDIRSIDEYRHFAWVAYKSGHLELAKEWLKLAPKHSGEAAWIRAKVALCEGKLTLAEESIKLAIQSPEMGPYHALMYAELGRIYLAQDLPREALTAWLKGKHWEDASYIAERVLSTDELMCYVDKTLDDISGYTEWANSDKEGKIDILIDLRTEVRHLLARRLMREGRVESALDYFPIPLRQRATDYLHYVQNAHNNDYSDHERAYAFWESAQLTRENGMKLFGTELYPDMFIWGGNFPWNDASEDRKRIAKYERGVLAPTKYELEQLDAHKVPTRRFHYRQRAAQLAWWAASLMPNNDETTANILFTAGSWIKDRYPEDADPFFKALVIRCPHTSLGKAAAERNWFPPMETEIPGMPEGIGETCSPIIVIPPGNEAQEIQSPVD